VSSRSETKLIPAATIMLLREQGRSFEVLILRRNRKLKAFGGAWVFPGGRVGESDAPGEDDITRARVAAIRETSEETGLDISGENLISLSCWIPPVQEKRRFSTWFFIARAPNDRVKIDQGEIHDFRWVEPKTLLSQIPSSDIMIMPPTYISLIHLAQYDTIDAIMSATAAAPDEIFETKFLKGKSGFVTLWRGDAAYDSLELETSGPRRRLICTSESWDYIT